MSILKTVGAGLAATLVIASGAMAQSPAAPPAPSGPPRAPMAPAGTMPPPKLTAAQEAAAAFKPDPKSVPFTNFDAIPWSGVTGRGNQQYIVYGDVNKPGPYVILMKWWPGSYSRPHLHEKTRHITVLQGTWWVSSSTKYDLTKTYPLPAGTVVRNEANEVHWDGARDELVILQISGEGPAPSLSVDETGTVVPRTPAPAPAPGGGN